MIERHLPYFVVVAQEEHFQRAADRLGITQSALSRRVQLLEEELGFQLFERRPRGVRLSPAGACFYKDVRQYMIDLGRSVERARNIVKGSGGEITVGINPSSASNPHVMRMLRTFRQDHPSLVLNLKMIYSDQQFIELKNNQIDVGIIYVFNKEPWAKYFDICMDRLVLAMPKEHPAAHKPQLLLEDLRGTQFIWPKRSQSPRIYDHMIAMWNAMGEHPNISIEVQSVESVINIVSMGLAAGFVSAHHQSQLPSAVVVREIADLPVEFPLCLVWRSDFDSPALRHLMSALSADQAAA